MIGCGVPFGVQLAAVAMSPPAALVQVKVACAMAEVMARELNKATASLVNVGEAFMGCWFLVIEGEMFVPVGDLGVDGGPASPKESC